MIYTHRIAVCRSVRVNTEYWWVITHTLMRWQAPHILQVVIISTHVSLFFHEHTEDYSQTSVACGLTLWEKYDWKACFQSCSEVMRVLRTVASLLNGRKHSSRRRRNHTVRTDWIGAHSSNWKVCNHFTGKDVNSSPTSGLISFVETFVGDEDCM